MGRVVVQIGVGVGVRGYDNVMIRCRMEKIERMSCTEIGYNPVKLSIYSGAVSFKVPT